MGRPRSFDENAVLDAAAAEFRVHGFAETSTEQLCEAAGVRRSSLYNTFVSKDELFVRSLEHYIAAIRARQTDILIESDAPAADRLRTLIDYVVSDETAAARHGHAAGCMVVHGLMSPDLRARDDRIARILERDVHDRNRLVADTIRIGQRDGSISTAVAPDVGALLVNTVISGVRVSAQTGLTPDELRTVALTGLRALFD